MSVYAGGMYGATHASTIHSEDFSGDGLFTHTTTWDLCGISMDLWLSPKVSRNIEHLRARITI